MVTRLSLKTVKADELYLDRLPRATKKAFLLCTKLSFLSRSGWYLAGGTALALQAGHRKSVDLDFFTPQFDFNRINLERTLLATGYWQTSFQQKGTLYGTLKQAKISFIAYPFFKPSAQRLKVGYIRILIPEDVAVMKIIAISQRGRKRDFTDLYWHCLNREPLEQIINRTIKQFKGQEHNLPHILKSLTYFDDANADPMPELHFKAHWRSIKAYFRRLVPQLTRKMLDIKL